MYIKQKPHNFNKTVACSQHCPLRHPAPSLGHWYTGVYLRFFDPGSSNPTTSFAKNLGFIFDSTISFSKQISSLSSVCHYHIRDLRRIRHTIDYSTASTIATTLVHSRLDYCNSLYHALPDLYRFFLVSF